MNENDFDEQKTTFDSLNFWELYNNIPDDPEKLVTPFWQDRLRDIKKDFSPKFPYSFLTNRVIRFTMFVYFCEYNQLQLNYLKGLLNIDDLRKLLVESYCGSPNTILTNDIITSGNTVHHAYHIMRYLEETKTSIHDIGSILEWGGGYGNMCKLWKRLNDKLTYIIVDLSLFSCIQYVYLSSIFGKEEVNLINGSDDFVKEGKINIIPLCWIKTLVPEIDMFVSTWALSESTKEAFELIKKKKSFGADKFLIAHQCGGKDFPEATAVKKLVKGEYYHEEIGHQPSNYYLFK